MCVRENAVAKRFFAMRLNEDEVRLMGTVRAAQSACCRREVGRLSYRLFMDSTTFSQDLCHNRPSRRSGP
jgi:hypothetical protein